MKTHHAVVGLLLGGILAATLSAQDAAATRARPVVVGTFDSRAVAIAYVRSDAFAERLRGLHAELEQAEADGDRERVAELTALGPAMQERVHRQGFGTAPVDDILERIENRLPGIAAELGVDVIVSKWALAYHRPEASFVDLTDRLTAEFDPDEATLRTIREIVASEPVPLEQLENHED